MRLTKTAAHAVLAMTHLADRSGDGLIQAKHIAAHLGIPTDSALKILQTLARYDLIQSRIGRSGGYQLLRDPLEVTLLEIIEAIDGPISTQLPVESTGGRLNGELDALRAVCAQTTDQIRQTLRQQSLANLVQHQSRATLAGVQ